MFGLERRRRRGRKALREAGAGCRGKMGNGEYWGDQWAREAAVVRTRKEMDERGTHACAIRTQTAVLGLATIHVASSKEKLFEVEARVVFEDTYLLKSNSVRTKQNVLLRAHP